jgi:hypothetical protein
MSYFIYTQERDNDQHELVRGRRRRKKKKKKRRKKEGNLTLCGRQIYKQTTK